MVNGVNEAKVRIAAHAFAIVIAIVCAAGCSSIPPYASVSPDPATVRAFSIPLRVTDAGALLVTVESSIGPLELVVDTGADQPLLLRAAADRHTALPRAGHEWSGRAHGAITRRPVHTLGTLTLGPLQFRDVAVTVDDTALPEFMGTDGLLGRRLLDGFTLDFDAPNGRLSMLPGGTLPEEVTASPEQWTAVPIDDLAYGPVIVVTLDDNPAPRRVVLDTGAIAFGPDGFLGIIELPRGVAPTERPADGPPIHRPAVMRAGDQPIGPFPLYVIDHPQPPRTHGFLGNVLFATHRVVIDPAGLTVYLRPAAPR